MNTIPDYVILDDTSILHKDGFIFDLMEFNVIYPIYFHNVTHKGQMLNIVKLMISKFYNIELTHEQYINLTYKDNNINNISLDNISLENNIITNAKDNKLYITNYLENANVTYYLCILNKYDINNNLLKCYNKINKVNLISPKERLTIFKCILDNKSCIYKNHIWKIEFKKILINRNIELNNNYIHINGCYYLSSDRSHIINNVTKKIITIYTDLKNHYSLLYINKKRTKYVLNYYDNPHSYNKVDYVNNSFNLQCDNFDKFTKNNNLCKNIDFSYANDYQDYLEETFDNHLYYQVKNSFLK